MSGKEAMMEGATAGRQGARPKKADVPAAAGGEERRGTWAEIREDMMESAFVQRLFRRVR